MSPSDAVVLARAAWSRLTEPGDLVAGAVIAALGPVDALGWLHEVAPHLPGGRVGADLPGLSPPVVRHLTAAAERWAVRLASTDPERELRVLERVGGALVVPEGPGWPSRLADLATEAPVCLWVRGRTDLDAVLDRSVSVIGARACTGYGERVAGDLASGLAARGWTVVSGGAYGIDAVAHRGALAGRGRTVAFLAGGVERPYPAGNAGLMAAVLERGGALVSEVPPGSVPSKVRFLQRNRLIAAATRGTVVVEAAWRSGALSTAGHASRLLRPVGAVPGPVTSVASAGCHRLLREGSAVCVTDTGEVLELVGDFGEHADGGTAAGTGAREADGLPLELRRTLEALPVRRPAEPESVARAAGLTVGEVRAGLGRLELVGLAVQSGGRWRRASHPQTDKSP